MMIPPTVSKTALRSVTALLALLALVPLAADALETVAVDGERLVDATGRQVILRGINAGGRSKMPPFYPFDPVPDFETALARYVDTIESLGFNVVRLLVIYEAAEPVRGHYDEDYLAIYDRMVEAFAERDIRIIIDSHQDVFSRRFCGDGFPDWMIEEGYRDREPRSDCVVWERYYFHNGVAKSFDRLWSNEDGVQDSFVAFFKMLAERYKDQPAVIGFEPINEPFPGWWGLAHYGQWHEAQLFPFYEKVAAATQSVDPRYMLFADNCSLENPGTWSTDRKKPDVAQLVLAPHYYDWGYLGLASSPGGSQKTMRNGLTKHSKWARVWKVPAFVTEYGVSMQRDDAYDYVTKLYEVFDELQLSGTIWEASASEQLWNMRAKVILEADGSIKPPAYALDRPYPRAVAGVIEKFSFDHDPRVFKLDWVQDPAINAPTEVYLPKQFYPDEPEVTLSAAGDYAFDEATRILSIGKSDKRTTRNLEVRP